MTSNEVPGPLLRLSVAAVTIPSLGMMSFVTISFVFGVTPCESLCVLVRLSSAGKLFLMLVDLKDDEQTPQLPPELQCAQREQLLHAEHDADPVHLAAESCDAFLQIVIGEPCAMASTVSPIKIDR